MSERGADLFRERLKEAIGVVSQFARRSGFKERTLRNWLLGVSRPGVDDLTEIAALTRRSVAWLVGEHDIERGVDQSAGIVRVELGARERMGVLTIKGPAHCAHIRTLRIRDPGGSGRDIPMVLSIEPPPQ